MGTVRGNINGNIVLEIHNSTSKIQGLDKSQRSILSGVLACKVPGYYFMQRYRNGSWDGTQRFYNALTSELPTGIVPLAINWLEENGLDYRIDDQRTNRDLEFQDVSAELNGKTLRDDQKQVVSQVENSHVGKHDWKFQRGIINMATNGGKTVVAEALIQNLLPKLKKTKRVILFCTGSLEIYNQAVKSLTQDLGFAVGRIQGSTWNLRPVTVAMIPTLNSRIKRADHLYTKLQEVCAGFIVDECLSKNSQVLLPGGITKTIEEVCNDDSITEVISYNHELNIFEPKQILRKIVTPGREQFWKVYFENPVTKKEGFLVCTKNHKIWSGSQGYVPLEQLNVGDVVKIHTGEKRQTSHNVKITKISKAIGLVPEFKYNLEIEDNHNYIANDLLVSNCHHGSSSTWYNTLMTLDNAFVRIGLSGTVADITKCKADKKLNAMRLNAISGAILAKVSNQQLITSQVSAKPLCYFATIDKPKLDKITYGVSSGVLGDLNYKDSYKLGIVNNNYRNWVVANICNSEVKATKAQCLVLIEFIEHGVNLLQMFEEFFPELNVVFLNGALAAEDRLRGLEMLKQGIADVVIATSILDEGVDVPSINALVYARAGKSDRKLLQGIGRGLRKKADGSTVRVYDFIDDTCKYLLTHSLERFKVLKGEDFSIKTLKLEDVNCGEAEFQKLFESGDMKVVDIPDTLSVSE